MNPTERGLRVAGILSGAWRASPPPIELSPEELDDLTPVLIRQGSGGLAWHRLRDSETASGTSASLLEDAFRYHTLQVRLLEDQLSSVLSYLGDQGIESTLLKGWALGRHYAGPGLRPYGDLDLLISPDQEEETREALTAPESPTAPVELHTHLPILRDRSAEELFRRSRLQTLGTTRVRVLGPEDELRLAALHGLNHGLCRPLWLCDVGASLEANSEEWDWDYATWGDPWLSEGFRCGLGLARELFGVQLESFGVPREWREAPLPEWMVPAALRAFGATDHYLGAGDPGELLMNPMRLVRAARLRWANPLEATYRRTAPWDKGARLPIQLRDYLSRVAGFLPRIPSSLKLNLDSFNKGPGPVP